VASTADGGGCIAGRTVCSDHPDAPVLLPAFNTGYRQRLVRINTALRRAVRVSATFGDAYVCSTSRRAGGFLAFDLYFIYVST